MATITNHALQRYIERVAPVPLREAREAIEHAFPAIHCAARIGCTLVVLGNGARLRLDGDKVVTVLAKRGGRKA